MRTTVRLSDELMHRVRMRATEERQTMAWVIEEALKVYLSKPKAPLRKVVQVPTSPLTGGTLPGVDLNRSADLEDLMDGR